VFDEDTLNSNSATKAATQQSIKAYIDSQVGTMDLDVAADTGTNIDVDLSNEVFTVAGGTNVASSVSGTTVTLTIDSGVATLTGTETFTNKTFTSPTIDTFTFSSGTSLSNLIIGGTGVVFEGATADAHETTLTAAEPIIKLDSDVPDENVNVSIVGLVKVLFVNVSVPVNVATPESIVNVTVVPDTVTAKLVIVTTIPCPLP
jgi:hypothetical protein